MNKFYTTILLVALGATSCASNSIYYRAIENTGSEFTFYEGSESELIHLTRVLAELKRDSASLSVYTDMKGAVHRILQEKCRAETKTYNFGNRVFMYHCPTASIYRSDGKIYVLINRLGKEPFESRGSTRIIIQPITQEAFAQKTRTLEEEVVHTKTWFRQDAEFTIEAWQFDMKYEKFRKEIEAELAKLKKKYNYVPDSRSMTTEKLLEIEHEIGLEIHGYCIDKFP
jgi:hypothetical protein